MPILARRASHSKTIQQQLLAIKRQFAVLTLLARYSRTKLRTGPEAAAACARLSLETALSERIFWASDDDLRFADDDFGDESANMAFFKSRRAFFEELF
jgi:hypothetical protein